MIDLMENLKKIKRWESGSEVKKSLVEVRIFDDKRNKELQYSFFSKNDKEGMTYDYIKNALTIAILQVPAIEEDKIEFMKRNDTLGRVPNIRYIKSKNRHHFDMEIDVNNLLD